MRPGLASEALPLLASWAPVHGARRDRVAGSRADSEADGKPERTPLARCTLYPNIPVHHGDQSLGDRQPEPGAAILARA
jgi:hypothetical protein